VKQVELFLEKGWITDFPSVFDLGNYREEILTLEGYKEKSVNNLMEALEKSRYTTLDRVFTAIGIPNVGKKTARLIAKRVFDKNPSDILAGIFSLSTEELLEVKDIGPETAEAFVEYMLENKESFERLLRKLYIQIPEVQL
jgi:DNA ligase (NAD+)